MTKGAITEGIENLELRRRGRGLNGGVGRIWLWMGGEKKEDRIQKTGFRMSNGEAEIGGVREISNFKLQIANFRLQISDYRLQIADCRLQISD
jgi:hypothetical protein